MSAIIGASYNDWADAVLVAYLRDNPRPPKADAVLAHLAVAGETWLARLDGQGDTTPDLWPTLPFEESAARLAAVDLRLGEPRDSEATVRYRNSVGDDFENTVAEIVAHALNHATYHRGEIAGFLLADGQEPPTTDLIAYLRGVRRDLSG